MQDSPWKENLQNKSGDPQQSVPVVLVEEYEDEDYYDLVAEIDIRSQQKKKPGRGGK